MKKTLFVFCLIAFFSGAAFAQLDTVRSNKNEFSIGYGFKPSSSFRYSPGNHIQPEMDNIGAIFVTYTRRLSKVVGIGATFCYDPVRLSYYDNLHGEVIPVCKVKESNYSLMLHMKFNWLNTKYVNLYSKVAVFGMHHVSYQQEEYHPELYEVIPPTQASIVDAYQITPIGIEVGTKQLAGFMQVGLGMEGVFSIGIRYGLKDKK